MRTQLGIVAGGVAGIGQVTMLQGAAGGSTTDATSWATGTYTPTASGLLVICVCVHTGTATLADATSVAGSSITSVVKQATILTVGNNMKTELWKAVSTASAGAVTFTFPATNTGSQLGVYECGNVNTAIGTYGLVQHASNSGTSTTAASVTLAAFSDTRNATFVVFGSQQGSGVTPKAGYTEFRDASQSSPNMGMETQFIISSDTSPSGTLGASGDYAGIAVEIASL